MTHNYDLYSIFNNLLIHKERLNDKRLSNFLDAKETINQFCVHWPASCMKTALNLFALLLSLLFGFVMQKICEDGIFCWGFESYPEAGGN
jgi:hypothetical protein